MRTQLHTGHQFLGSWKELLKIEFIIELLTLHRRAQEFVQLFNVWYERPRLLVVLICLLNRLLLVAVVVDVVVVVARAWGMSGCSTNWSKTTERDFVVLVVVVVAVVVVDVAVVVVVDVDVVVVVEVVTVVVVVVRA